MPLLGEHAMKRVYIVLLVCIVLITVHLISCSKTKDIIYVDDVRPTVETDGTIEYWKDLSSGKMYDDCNCEHEIESPLSIAKLQSYVTNDYFYDGQSHWKYQTNSNNIKTNIEEHTFENGVCTICGYIQDTPNWKSTEYVERIVKENLALDYLTEAKLLRINNLIANGTSSSNPDFYGKVIALEGEQSQPIEDVDSTTIYIFKNVSYSGEDTFIKSNSNNRKFIVLLDGTANSIKVSNSAINVLGDLYILGAGSLKIESQNNGIEANNICVINTNIDIQANGVGISANKIEFDSASIKCSTQGDGICSHKYIYAKDSNFTMNAECEYVFNSDENKEKYKLSDKDFLYKGRDGFYGLEKNKGVLDYALLNSAKGMHVIGGKDDFNKNVETIIDGLYLYNCNLNVNSKDDCVYVEYGNAFIFNSKCLFNTLCDAIRTDGIIAIIDSIYEVEASYEGIEAGYIEISNSDINIKSNDDCIEGSSYYDLEGWAIVKDSTIQCISDADDGFDTTSETLVINSKITLFGSYNGEGFDLDKDLIVYSGEIFTIASYGGEIYTNRSKQSMIVLSMSAKMAKGDKILLKTKSGEVLFEGEALAPYGLAVFSSSIFKIGDEYDIYLNDRLLLCIEITGIITRVIV